MPRIYSPYQVERVNQLRTEIVNLVTAMEEMSMAGMVEAFHQYRQSDVRTAVWTLIDTNTLHLHDGRLRLKRRGDFMMND